MDNKEQLLRMSREAEEMCGEEVKQILMKYGCSIHYQQQLVDGAHHGGGIFFRFRPEMLTQGKQNGG